jgi:thiol-disulfide isomerase/thioredoxin
MKKFFSLFIIAVLVLSLSAAAFADESEELVLDDVGITFHLPEAFRNSVGTLIPDAGALGNGIYYAEIIYFAMPEDECVSLLSKNDRTEEETDKLSAAIMYPFVLIGLDGNRGIEEVRAIFAGDIEDENVSQVFQEDDFSYFLYVDREGCEQYAATLDTPFAEDFAAILSAVDELTEKAEFYKPVSPYDSLIGNKVSFTTTDTDGNPVTSEELFAGNKVTVVNIWASWCGPCIRELPELEEISARLAGQNCGVVGLLYDGDDAAALADAKQTMKDAGVTYPVILPPEKVDVLFPLEAFPTTYFVDREGCILTEPVIGALVNQYESTVNELLNGME